MKKLKEIVNKEILNIEELMLIKGATGATGVAAGCESHACTNVACNTVGCNAATCQSNACNTSSCRGAVCSQHSCSGLQGTAVTASRQ